MKILSLFLCVILLMSFCVSSFAKEEGEETETNKPTIQLPSAPDVSAKSAILYEATTGTVLYEKNANEALPPASVTKVMTLLLVAEAIGEGKIALDDKVIISPNAASMGGSQVFLKEGEEMTVEELLKCTVIASANDASVALAEYVAGSEENFIRRMNERAKELSLGGCVFENTTGLDDTVTNHTMSASDIAILSAMLVKYDFITKYSSLWQDTIRDGAFTLTNTNRLVRYYEGCNGLKTGSTDKAGYCVSVSAKRKNLSLICVIMGAESRDERNNCARTLLDYGFASVSLYHSPNMRLEQVGVYNSKIKTAWLYESEFSILCEKGMENKIEKVYNIPEFICAPLKSGDKVGNVAYYLDGEKIGEGEILILEDIRTLNYLDMLTLIFSFVTRGNIVS